MGTEKQISYKRQREELTRSRICEINRLRSIGKTWWDVAESLGISVERIRQIRKANPGAFDGD